MARKVRTWNAIEKKPRTGITLALAVDFGSGFGKAFAPYEQAMPAMSQRENG